MKKSKRRSDNKRNLLYFEAPTMSKLYAVMSEWQQKNKKRLLSASIQRDKELFCCIAVTNPSEVIIKDGGSSGDGVDVTNSALKVYHD